MHYVNVTMNLKNYEYNASKGGEERRGEDRDTNLS
jgi:hypothetical protein